MCLDCLKETLGTIISSIKISQIDACGALILFTAKLQCMKRLQFIAEAAVETLNDQWVPVSIALGQRLTEKIHFM